jgi:tetratricopeptide (TPR) repeat protein
MVLATPFVSFGQALNEDDVRFYDYKQKSLIDTRFTNVSSENFPNQSDKDGSPRAMCWRDGHFNNLQISPGCFHADIDQEYRTGNDDDYRIDATLRSPYVCNNLNGSKFILFDATVTNNNFTVGGYIATRSDGGSGHLISIGYYDGNRPNEVFTAALSDDEMQRQVPHFKILSIQGCDYFFFNERFLGSASKQRITPNWGAGNKYTVIFRNDASYTGLSKDNPLPVVAYTFSTIQRHGTDKDYYCRLGQFFYAYHKMASAIQAYAEAIALDPSYPVAYWQRALCYRATGAFDEAITDYTSYLQLNSGDGARYCERGDIYLYKADLINAINDFDKAIQLNAGSPAYFRKAIYLVITKQFSAAVSLSNQYQQQFQSSFYRSDYVNESYLNDLLDAGIKYLSKNDYADALTSLQSASAKYGANTHRVHTMTEADTRAYYSFVLLMTGYVYEKLGEMNKALDLYRQSYTINPLLRNRAKAEIARVKNHINSLPANERHPVVTLYSPPNARDMGKKRMTLTDNQHRLFISGNAQAPGGISAVTINGQPVREVHPDGNFSIYLDKPDNNTLQIQVADIRGIRFDTSFTLSQPRPGDIESVVPQQTKYYALLIAEQTYNKINGFPDLNTTISELNALAGELRKDYTFDSIILLPDASKTEILAKLNAISHHNNGEDYNLLICFSGHGGVAGGTPAYGYWVPVDMKQAHAGSERDVYLYNVDVEECLVGSDAKQILLISDACYSGYFAHLTTNDMPDEDKTKMGDRQNNHRGPQGRLQSRYIMTSGDVEEVTAESILVPELITALKNNEQAVIQSRTLFNSFSNKVQQRSSKTPTFEMFGPYGQQSPYVFEFCRRLKQ